MNVTQIVGTGSYLPGDPIGVDTLTRLVGGVAADLVEALGAFRRYWAVDPATGAIRECNTDMAAKAAQRAIDDAGIEAGQIDAVISVTATPDYSIPGNAPIIQEKLGIGECAAFELRAGCNGVAQAVTLADQLIRTGFYQTVLVVGSELTSSYLVPSYLQEDESLTKNDMLNLIMFGDGAGAIVLRGNADPDAPGIVDSYLNSIGAGRAPGFILQTGGSKHPTTSDAVAAGNHRWVHDYKSVAEMDKTMAWTAMNGILQKTGVNPDDIRMIIVPQANSKRIRAELHSTDNPLQAYAERFFVNVDEVGNTSSAGVLIALDEVRRKQVLQRDDLLLVVGAESSKWLCGALLIKWAL